ncbi:hypothetical protein H6G96_11570 [Nostoc sp. FACHB-892]|uniref:hypothetical protein n=1 Tax=Nostoc sp. FACHB-892 TaxID=2692843 RepID=UPI00168711B7|nr:hypothetical protein [Nostoc sp. FACHB-892]MBD2726950.1 hypothetical protein [Nostoc sp. FACHB-892]
MSRYVEHPRFRLIPSSYTNDIHQLKDQQLSVPLRGSKLRVASCREVETRQPGYILCEKSTLINLGIYDILPPAEPEIKALLAAEDAR